MKLNVCEAFQENLGLLTVMIIIILIIIAIKIKIIIIIINNNNKHNDSDNNNNFLNLISYLIEIKQSYNDTPL